VPGNPLISPGENYGGGDECHDGGGGHCSFQ
jgi:hypothetical protein